MPCCPATPEPTSSASNEAAPPSAVAQTNVHVHLHVADLASAVGFYRAFLGAEPVKLKPGYAKFLPTWAPVNLALSELATATGGAVSHLGIQLPTRESVKDHLRRVETAGLPVRVEMGVDCCHANQDKFWVTAPGGIEWEVYHLNHDIDESPVLCATVACCAR